ncbi:protein lchn [Anaeramoeba flamelloides]|uniref:Protein lchn n=1 Tax=Anaeramoeba flamelloides TaxID=1746091 RepID=A0ABQ8XVU3_9EUKA|nr:protein lchn [Anaeramoeba flamelloides]
MSLYQPLLKNTSLYQIVSEEEEEEVSTDSEFEFNYDLDEINNKLIALFFVRFDVRVGNVVEWVLPENFGTDGLEFKALVSSFHQLDEDYVFFKFDKFYGLASLYCETIEDEEESKKERGVRMRSLGVLSLSYTNLYPHLEFLRKSSSELVYDKNEDFSSQFSHLIEYFEEHQTKTSLEELREIAPTIPFQKLELHHPIATMSAFCAYFEQNLFLIWKASHLRLKVLFLSAPPIALLSSRIYSSCLIATFHKNDPLLKYIPKLNPLFYVNLVETEMLQSSNHFIAFSTETIFFHKPDIWDICFQNNTPTISQDLKKSKTLEVTEGDKKRWQTISNILQKSKSLQNEKENENEKEKEKRKYGTFSDSQLLNDTIIKTFRNWNDNLLKFFVRAETGESTITISEIEELGFHKSDRIFLQDLLNLYNIDATIEKNSCCCC